MRGAPTGEPDNKPFQQRLIDAYALIDQIDRMPGPQSCKAMAKPEAQSALELIHKARLQARLRR